MLTLLGINSGPPYKSDPPVRDPLYLRFIRRLPCVACLRTWRIEAAHTGPHGIGQKASDLKTIPLCRDCHREYHAGPVRFVEKHRLDIPALIAMFNHFYQTKIKKEAA